MLTTQLNMLNGKFDSKLLSSCKKYSKYIAYWSDAMARTHFRILTVIPFIQYLSNWNMCKLVGKIYRIDCSAIRSLAVSLIRCPGIEAMNGRCVRQKFANQMQIHLYKNIDTYLSVSQFVRQSIVCLRWDSN